MRLPGFESLIDLVEGRRRDTPAAAAFWFGGTAYTFDWLATAADSVAGGLSADGIGPEDRVVLAFPNGPDFFAAFYGVQRLGAIAVPVFPGSGSDRLRAIAGYCGARRVLLPDSPPQPDLDELGLRLSQLRGSSGASRHRARPEQMAYIQYTSGSTGNPKGVVLTHANLLTNVGQMLAGMEITHDDVFVSWLPAYHDMGLVLMTMAPFAVGAPLHLLPADLRSVRPWLTTLHRVRGTFTASPDFGYRLLLRQAEPGVDLRSLRVALNAAEPVRPATLERFHETFGLRDVMVAGYGLAEATVGVSMWPPGTTNAVDAGGRVSAGRPFPGVEIEIDGGGLGEILVRSPASTTGYLGNPAASEALRGPNGSIRSGDLGYLDGSGNLYVAGRIKEILKLGGETVAPEEVEETAESVPGVRAAAAVGIERGAVAGEQIYVFAEVRGPARSDPVAMEATVVGVAEAVHRRLGRRPGRVYLVRHLPRTPNGKLQRARLREWYLDGSLRRDGALLFPGY